MWTIYFIQNTETKRLYIGVTNNLKRRITEHNNNENYATRHKTGTETLVYAEAYRSKTDAYMREEWLK